MRRLNPLTVLFTAAAVLLGGLMAAAPALAYNIRAVYKDCENNGALTGHYSRAELQAALNNIPSQVAEYSTCQVLIQQALLKASSPPGGGHHPTTHNTLAAGGSHRGGGGSGTASSRHHKGKVDKSATDRRGRAASSGSTSGVTPTAADIRPGSTGTGGSSSLPVALIVVLILLALTAVSGGVIAIRRRVDAGPGT